MAREPELSIKVKVDPQIDAAKLQEDINKKIPKDGVEIKGKLNAKELLKSISAYQEGGQNLVPLLAKISNVDEALKAFENKETETKVSLKATQSSLDTIRDQLQGVIDGLDYSKLKGTSAPASTSSTRRTKKSKKTTAVDANTAVKQEIPVDVVGTISDDSVTALKTKIEAGLNDVAIVANIAPDQLSKIREDVEAAFNGITITPTVKGVNGAVAQTGAKKKINIPSDDKIMEQMANGGNNKPQPPPPTPPNPQPSNGGNNTPSNNGNPPSQKSLEEKLENAQDTSSDKNHQKNVLTQINRKGQLWNRAYDIEKELDANYPGWSAGKS